MQIISLRWTPLAKDVISLKVKNLTEQLKKKEEKSSNYQTLPKFAFHTWNKDAYICSFYRARAANYVEKSQKEGYSGFKVAGVLKEILNLGV